jgi:nucleotide-binding universal stress UspA family protein
MLLGAADPADARDRRSDTEGLIVVGVDGSEPARVALGFALAEAGRRSARLRVVTAYHPPEYWPVGYGMASEMVVPPSDEQLAAEAEQTARRAVEEAVQNADSAARSVPVDVEVVRGNPAKVLVDQASDADLLVVGHRGRGAIASACLGSVGLQCVLHATCPVVVVRPSGEREPTAAAHDA